MTHVSVRLIREQDDPMKHIDMQEVRNQLTWAAALSLCANKSGRLDKIIAAEMGIDCAVWSRMKSGQNAPSGEQLCRLMDYADNEAPLFWLLMQRGYDPRSLRRIETDVERENRELREQMQRMQNEREIERRTIRDLINPKVDVA